MKSIGIVAEGITDYVVISNIVYGFFGGEEPIIKPIQPVFDEDQVQKKGYAIQSAEEFGGWVNVFDYCKDQKRLSKDMQGLDYLIIQIDTDTSEEANYDISKYDDNNQELSPSGLIEKVIEKLNTLIINANQQDFFNYYQEKIIFAVAVHSTECWLLLLYASKKSDIEATKNCHNRLEKIRKESIKKEYRIYDNLSKSLMKQKELYKIKDKNPSLKIFIENLERQVTIES
jgi:hypothetical protein